MAFFALLLAVPVLCSGCWDRAGAPEDAQVNQTLGADEARLALIEMIQRSEEENVRFLKRRLAQLEIRDQIRVERGSETRIGDFWCDLKKRQFLASISDPPDHRKRYHWWEYRWEGVFEQSSDGKWRAKITHYEKRDYHRRPGNDE